MADFDQVVVDDPQDAEAARVVQRLAVQFRDGVDRVPAERSILGLEKIYINGGRRGYLIGIAPQVLVDLLPLTAVDCALADAA